METLLTGLSEVKDEQNDDTCEGGRVLALRLSESPHCYEEQADV